MLRHPNGDPFSLTNRFRGGDTVQNTVGILGYDFSLYRIFPTGPADYTAVNPRPAAPEAVGRHAARGGDEHAELLRHGRLPDGRPARQQVRPGQQRRVPRLGQRPADEFTRQRDKLLAALSGLDADIIGLNELENTTGVEPLADIVAGLPGYAYVDTGTIGTDAIKVGLIYRPRRRHPGRRLPDPRLQRRPALPRHQEPSDAGPDVPGQRDR